jgi:hypothetical protein
MKRIAAGFAALASTLFLVATVGARPPAPQSDHRCDLLDPSVCLYPWPNDYFTTADPTTDTGLRLNIASDATPSNVQGTHIDPTDFNRNDGFSPGQPIVTKVPGLDTQEALAQTGAPTLNSLERSFDPDQSIVVIDASTGQRQLIWAEVDANASSPANAALEIHPAVNFREGHRYIVALRNLRDANGDPIEAQDSFRTLRDQLPSDNPLINERRAHYQEIFRTLKDAGIKRKDLYLAWDFTVASERNLSERMLSIRDDAFAQLGDTNLSDLAVQGGVPPHTDTSVTDFPPCGDDGCQAGESDQLIRRVQGTFVVPCYLDQVGCPVGSKFLHDPPSNPLPTRLPGNTFNANFVCNIPRSAAGNGTVEPARPSLYGHGLFGSANEVNSGAVVAFASEHNFVMCATNWIGMANEDRVYVATQVLTDLSKFSSVPDRVQQGMLDFLYLGRLMDNPAGFNSDPNFQLPSAGGTASVIDPQRLYYVGGSQGGIIGGSLTAVAPDWNRAALGVPGMNYSILVPRSVDFDAFKPFLYGSYTNELERPLIFSMLQLLWDRSEANGYAWHMTSDPLPNTPPHKVILDEAFGDHQVSNFATEVEARTIGAQLREPDLDPGRATANIPFFGIPRIQSFPFNGSLLEIWDVGPLRVEDGVTKGTPPPPITNVPNRLGVDPHGPDASEEPTARTQVSEFLQPDALSQIIDVCGPHPCYLAGWTGPPSP